jgi:hypothetical protein
MQVLSLYTGQWTDSYLPEVTVCPVLANKFGIIGHAVDRFVLFEHFDLSRYSLLEHKSRIVPSYRKVDYQNYPSLRCVFSGNAFLSDWFRKATNRREPTTSIPLGRYIGCVKSTLRLRDTPKLRFERWLTLQLLRIGSIHWWRKWLYFLWRHLSSSKRVRKLAEGEFLRVGKHFSCCLLTRRFSDDFHVSRWSCNPDRGEWIDVEKVIVALLQKQFSLPLLSSRMDVFRVGRCTRPRLNKHRMITSSTQSQGCRYDPVDRVVRIGTESSEQSFSRPSVVGRVPSCIRQIQCPSEGSSAFESNRCWRKSVSNLQDLSS